jgi:hypothetical protein
MRGMHGDAANSDQMSILRTLLVDLEWAESDAWVLTWELSDIFPGTLMQDTPTSASMPAEDSAEPIRELERILAEGYVGQREGPFGICD